MHQFFADLKTYGGAFTLDSNVIVAAVNRYKPPMKLQSFTT